MAKNNSRATHPLRKERRLRAIENMKRSINRGFHTLSDGTKKEVNINALNTAIENTEKKIK